MEQSLHVLAPSTGTNSPHQNGQSSAKQALVMANLRWLTQRMPF